MNELDRASEQIQNLMIDMVMVMEKYKEDSGKIVDNIQKELDSSLNQQRKMIVDMVRDDILHHASTQVKAYTQNMDDARKQMVEQVREFNTYLCAVKSENQKISDALLRSVNNNKTLPFPNFFVAPFKLAFAKAGRPTRTTPHSNKISDKR